MTGFNGELIRIGDCVRAGPDMGGEAGGVVVAIAGDVVVFLEREVPRRMYGSMQAHDLIKHVDCRTLDAVLQRMGVRS